jgi:hypothetical protein
MHKIYFGDVKIQDTRTGEIKTVEKKIYLESDTPPAIRLRSYVLKAIPHKERERYRITKLCFDSAKVTGITAY